MEKIQILGVRLVPCQEYPEKAEVNLVLEFRYEQVFFYHIFFYPLYLA